MEFNSFDMDIQSDEFAHDYGDWLAYLDSQWEEPEEWKSLD